MAGNLYNPHPLMAAYATYWRCDHGSTGFRGTRWVGCWRCALRNPLAYLRFRFTKD